VTPSCACGSLSFQPQAQEGVTYAHKIEKAEARIDWSKSATALHDHIRGLSPFPGAFFEGDFGKGVERIKVLRAELASAQGEAGRLIGDDLTIACGEGALRLIDVQRAGKAPMSAAEFLRGVRVKPPRLA